MATGRGRVLTQCCCSLSELIGAQDEGKGSTVIIPSADWCTTTPKDAPVLLRADWCTTVTESADWCVGGIAGCSAGTAAGQTLCARSMIQQPPSDPLSLQSSLTSNQ